MNNILVSVVVPVYNVDKYLSICVNSIISQTYQELDIILVDDGSTDNSAQICDTFAASEKRIRVIHQTNKGLSGARNAGLDIARGEYVFLVDSDDFITKDIIEMMLEDALSTEADIVVCNNIRCSEKDNLNSMCIPEYSNEIIQLTGDEKIKSFLTKSDIKVCAWGKLYKSYLFRSIRYPEGRYHEDNFTTYKLVDLAKKITITQQVGYIYRNTSTSITNEKFSMKRWDEIIGKLEQLDYVKQKYPHFAKFAETGVVYGCNQMIGLMGKSSYYDEKLYQELYSYYHLYIWSYLCSNATLKGKLISIIAYISPKIAANIIRITTK